MPHAPIEEFSLLGGPLHQFGARLGLVRGDDTIALGLTLGWLSWLVLVFLAFAKGAPAISSQSPPSRSMRDSSLRYRFFSSLRQRSTPS